jgi:16S rRNA (cytosine967-C5)-methyltransferase
MSAYYHSYQSTASSILGSFSFKESFPVYLKKFFKQHKKYGSRDRKIIADLCFGFFRIGNAASAHSLIDQMVMGYFLTHDFDGGYLAFANPSLVDKIGETIDVKVEIIREQFKGFQLAELFPCHASVSADVDQHDFALHHLRKPSFFLRVRPLKRDKVLAALKAASIPAKLIGDIAIRIDANVDVEKLIDLDVDAVVQDISSQKTINLLTDLPAHPTSIWDACAGSGGKSIMLADRYRKVGLYVSDIREEILEELERRFKLAGIIAQKLFCTDLQHPMSTQVAKSNLPEGGVDLIVADVPCSGSGTWGRTPELLRSFDQTMISEYQFMQKSIVSRLPAQLNPGGHLLYITCSVFKEENDEVVDYIQQSLGLGLVRKEMISGVNEGGDHLFAALFTS